MDNSVGRTAQSQYVEIDGKKVRVKRVPMSTGKKKFSGKAKDNSISVFDKFAEFSNGGHHRTI